MDAKIYVLDPSTKTWSLKETIKNIDNCLFKQIEAHVEENQGQVKVEYEN